MIRSPSNARLYDNLLIGKREVGSHFAGATRLSLKAGESLAAAPGSGETVYCLRAGWACQFHDLIDGRRAILDVYLPGDVIGLDAVFHTRPMAEVLTLTSATVESIDAEGGLSALMARPHTALYFAWLLSKRQQRADRLLAAVSSLDARGRLAVMVLDFYDRLSRQRLITSTIYSLPLTQNQIGSYLGLTVVHVNRVLRSLRDELIVAFEKHCVTILDFEQLARLAHDFEMTRPTSCIGEESLNLPPLLTNQSVNPREED